MPPQTTPTQPKKLQLEEHKEHLPKGLGLFIRVMAERTIEDRVLRMADNGVTWAAIGAYWQKKKPVNDIIINSPNRCHKIIDSMLKYSLTPYLWGYPWKGRHKEFAECMLACTKEGVPGWIPDPEVGLKDSDDEEAAISAKHLFWACVDAFPAMILGFTSYGQIKGHPTFPWDSFLDPDGFSPLNECDFHCPQLYDQPPSLIRRGLESYKNAGADVIIPAFGTFKYEEDTNGTVTYPRMNQEELTHHLQVFTDLRDEFDLQAMIGWSESQISQGGWRAISHFSSLW